MFSPASTLRSSVRSLGSVGFYTAAQASATALALAAGALWAANLGDSQHPTGFPPSGGEVIGVRQAEDLEQGPPLDVSPPQDTIYIVGSEPEAHALRLLLAQDAAIRSAMGGAPVRDEVVIAASAEEAKQVKAAIEDGNSILASQGAAEVRVVNFVGNVATQGTTLPPDRLNYPP